MARYKIVGYERNAGTKKTGQPYDWHIIHAVAERPMKGKDKVGCACLTQMVGADEGILTQIPAPGEIWELSFDNRGRLDDAYPAE